MATVHVPQKTGPITISYSGDPADAKTYHAKDNEVTVAADDVPAFLLIVDGSRPADDKAKDAAKPTPDPSAPALSPSTPA